jgi:F0F1-type ATP synthase assembly protein I
MTVSLEMVLPGVAGYVVDRRVGIEPLLTVVGFGLGMVLGIWHLIRMTRSAEETGTESEDEPS